MEHDYAGARTMGSEFLEYLWGWQVTNPTLVGDWAWEEVKAVYIDDRYDLQLDEFLEEGHNAHVKSNMLAIMLVAINKQFWQADQQTIEQLASEFADLVAVNGLPGSGHTDPDNPMLPWLQDYLSERQWQAIAERISAAKGTPEDIEETANKEIHRIAEIEFQPQPEMAENLQNAAIRSEQDVADTDPASQTVQPWYWWLGGVLLLLIAIGFYRGIAQANQLKKRRE